MKVHRTLPATVLALFAAAVLAQDSPVKLARTYKAGEEVRYKSVVSFDFMGSEGKVTRNSRIVVKDVKEGKVTLVTIDEGGTLDLGGNESPAPPGPQVTEIRELSGKLVDAKWDESAESVMTPEIVRLSAAVGETLLQDKEVKPGDSWTIEVDNPAVKDKKIAVKTTFVGIEKVDGADLWKVKQTSEADTDASGRKMTTETTSWLDPANGQLVKAEGKIVNIPTRFGEMSWNIKTERVKPEKKAAL